jgi:hypothetical protein
MVYCHRPYRHCLVHISSQLLVCSFTRLLLAVRTSACALHSLLCNPLNSLFITTILFLLVSSSVHCGHRKDYITIRLLYLLHSCKIYVYVSSDNKHTGRYSTPCLTLLSNYRSLTQYYSDRQQSRALRSPLQALVFAIT